jgi:hypothetical protein
MAEVVGVHGIGQEQRGPNDPDWSRWLKNGIEFWERKSGVPCRVPSFKLAFYGNRFLSEDDAGRPAMSAPELYLDSLASDLTASDAEFLSEVAAEAAANLPDRGKPMGGFNSVPKILQPVVRLLETRIDGKLVLMFVAELKQVRRYLEDKDLASEVQADVLRTITPETKVLLGHSLGSVVAYETIAVHKLHMPTLLTLGSPLGMKTVEKRLRAKLEIGAAGDQPGVARWSNIFDPADPVAGAGPLRRLWPAVQDWNVGNDDEPHSIERYLNKPISGEIIATAAAP